MISLVITTYSGTESVLNLINSFKVPFKRDIIVINNGTHPEHNRILRQKLDPDIKFIDIIPSIGLAQCWNLGIIFSKYSKLIISNDDVIFDEKWYEKIKGINALEINMAKVNTFSCFLIDKKIITKIGWFDENFIGMYYEDEDWYLRLQEYALKNNIELESFFKIMPIVEHSKTLRKNEYMDKSQMLKKEPNEKYFFEKWKQAGEGFKPKGHISNRLQRNLPEIDWHPYYTKLYKEMENKQ